jgi:tryptophanyl-tRNA synthetase
MVTPLGWLERVPTYKEALDNVKNKDLHTYGFLGYPVLQTSDIVMYGEPEVDLIVPVGEDQVSHVELSREIVRRFNFWNMRMSVDPALTSPGNEVDLEKAKRILLTPEQVVQAAQPVFGVNMPALELSVAAQRRAQDVGLENFYREIGDLARYFPCEQLLNEPQWMLTRAPRIPGLDGRKMSKSYGNAITLSESDADIRAKTKVMVTDPARKRRTDPGNPDVCPVYDWHKLFSPPETLKWSAEGCRSAGIGCIECKVAMADNLIKWIERVRTERKRWESDPGGVLQVLENGKQRASEVARATMARVREAVFKWSEKRAEIAQRKSATQNAKVGD